MPDYVVTISEVDPDSEFINEIQIGVNNDEMLDIIRIFAKCYKVSIQEV